MFVIRLAKDTKAKPNANHANARPNISLVVSNLKPAPRQPLPRGAVFKPDTTREGLRTAIRRRLEIPLFIAPPFCQCVSNGFNHMMTSLRFENFRGFTDLRVAPLKRINLITGANNTGKTGLLEGLFLLFYNNQVLWPLQSMPGMFRSSVAGPGLGSAPSPDDFSNFWESLFHDRQMNVEPTITGINAAGASCVCRLKVHPGGIHVIEELTPNGARQAQIHPSPPFHWTIGPNGVVGQANKINPSGQDFIVLSTKLEHPIQDAELFNQVSLTEGGEEKLLSFLKQIDSRLVKLRYAKAPRMSQALVYAHFGQRNALSITQSGQGFSKLFSLYCRMLLSKAKIVFIDEIENGLYYETLPQIWKGIAALAETENIQIFATTHSRECIVAAHEVMAATPDYNFALHRLQRVDGKIEAITHDKEMMKAALSAGLEVR